MIEYQLLMNCLMILLKKLSIATSSSCSTSTFSLSSGGSLRLFSFIPRIDVITLCTLHLASTFCRKSDDSDKAPITASRVSDPKTQLKTRKIFTQQIPLVKSNFTIARTHLKAKLTKHTMATKAISCVAILSLRIVLRSSKFIAYI
jgi:hypothetical protein